MPPRASVRALRSTIGAAGVPLEGADLSLDGVIRVFRWEYLVFVAESSSVDTVIPQPLPGVRATVDGEDPGSGAPETLGLGARGLWGVPEA